MAIGCCSVCGEMFDLGVLSGADAVADILSEVIESKDRQIKELQTMNARQAETIREMEKTNYKLAEERRRAEKWWFEHSRICLHPWIPDFSGRDDVYNRST